MIPSGTKTFCFLEGAGDQMRGMVWWCVGLLLALGCARPENAGSPFPGRESATSAEEKTTEMENSPFERHEDPDNVAALPSTPPVTPPKRIRTRPTLDERFLFQPWGADWGNYHPRNLQFEDVYFRAEDGARLHGWYCPCENPRAYVLFAHGNGGNITVWTERMRELQGDYNVSVFIFDYRGYGKSQGRATVAGALQDARAAARWLAKKAGIEESDLVLMGQSLGGAIAVQLAAEIAPQGLILESTFSSFRDVADHHAKWASWLVPKQKLDSVQQIGKYRGPLLQCHGDQDSVVPYALGKKLFEAANDPKTFVPMEGGDHNTPLTRTYRWKLDDFFQDLAADSFSD